MKQNFSFKKFNKQILSINDLIESYFNKLKYFKTNYKKILLNKENRVFLGSATVVILTLSYLLLPTLYDKDLIQSEIKNQLKKNYNVEVKFDENISYGLLPKPHFSAKNLSILRDNKTIGIAKKFKIFIDIKHFFSIDQITIKNLVFYKTDFKIYFKDLNFFINLLKTEPNENKILFKNSNIFFNNKNDEVLFINKIYNSKFFYDSRNLQNILSSKNEIFNIPFKLLIKNDKFNKKMISEFNSRKIRLNVENETNYNEKDILDGLIDILFINKSTSINYEIGKDSLKFLSKERNNLYNGEIEFKPFYFSANFNYDGLSTKNLFNDDSIFIDLIRSEILNNKNLNANIKLNIKDITNISELKNLILKIKIEEGDVGFAESNIMWKDDLKITLDDSLLSISDDDVNLVGTLIIDFINLENFFRSFQIIKEKRKKIKKIQVNFVYNINNSNMSFDYLKIDNKQNNNVEEFLNEFNSKNDRRFNKITFKNFIHNFFSVYAG
tara:strand:- start:267 stop:1757 length:1491 start_codon:yes stop_codon:yes gene_type:complete